MENGEDIDYGGCPLYEFRFGKNPALKGKGRGGRKPFEVWQKGRPEGKGPNDPIKSVTEGDTGG